MAAVLAGAALLASVGGPSATAYASPTSTTATPFDQLPAEVVHGLGVLPVLSPEELQDADTFARASGVSESASRSKMQGQPIWQTVVGEIQSKYPSEFAGAGREPDGTGAWITIVGQPQAAVTHILQRLPFDVSLHYGAPLSYASLRDAADAAVGTLQSAEEQHVGFHIDDLSGAIAISFTPADGTDPASAEEAARAAAAMRMGHTPLPVELKFDITGTSFSGYR